ncbi:MAG: hypothetical protein EOO50_11655 [Flavobacterium sp.]|uniref:hypothetical protein n=1 Tax=Flavobacterium sp. TaxID=239 RepID=UPI0011F6500C|nr:hypothetical protein [Flavobacterium sp.]RZJ65915.1 MAG: hypothetical protein EOO50_11655 [Flavobacterium sp.]
MLGFLFIYFIGKYFYDLAGKFEKHKWGYTILAVVVYYAGTVVFLIPLFLIGNFVAPDSVEGIDDTVVGLIGIPFGILSNVLLYKFLKWKWEKEAAKVETIEDIGVIEELR